MESFNPLILVYVLALSLLYAVERSDTALLRTSSAELFKFSMAKSRADKGTVLDPLDSP